MQANRARLSVYPQYVFLSSFVAPFVGQFDFFSSPDAFFYPFSMLLTSCATTPYLPYVPHSRLPVRPLVANRILYGQMSPVPAFCDLSLLSVLAVPIANRRLLFQPHPSHGYYQHPTGLCRGQGNDLAKCPEGFWDPIGHPFLLLLSLRLHLDFLILMLV